METANTNPNNKMEMEIIIKELEVFRKNKDFEDKTSLRKKILRLSEQMDYWLDSGNGLYIESVSDYDNYNIFELQALLLDRELTLIESFENDDFNIPSKWNKQYQEAREEFDRISSYYNIEEFFEK